MGDKLMVDTKIDGNNNATDIIVIQKEKQKESRIIVLENKKKEFQHLIERQPKTTQENNSLCLLLEEDYQHLHKTLGTDLALCANINRHKRGNGDYHTSISITTEHCLIIKGKIQDIERQIDLEKANATR